MHCFGQMTGGILEIPKNCPSRIYQPKHCISRTATCREVGPTGSQLPLATGRMKPSLSSLPWLKNKLIELRERQPKATTLRLPSSDISFSPSRVLFLIPELLRNPSPVKKWYLSSSYLFSSLPRILIQILFSSQNSSNTNRFRVPCIFPIPSESNIEFGLPGFSFFSFQIEGFTGVMLACLIKLFFMFKFCFFGVGFWLFSSGLCLFLQELIGSTIKMKLSNSVSCFLADLYGTIGFS